MANKVINMVFKARDDTKSALSSVKSGLAGIASHAISVRSLIAGSVGGAGIGLFLRQSFQALEQQQQAEAKLAAILRSTGGAAGYSADQLKRMASGLQNVTTFGDQAIVNAQAILATFTQIRGDVFEGAIKSSLNLSATLGQDLQSSVVQIGKALNDPIKGITALSRVGVSFSEQQKETIKGLVESNQVMEAQRLILQELQTEFGGVAEEMAKTAGGQVQQLKNAFGDLTEELAAGLAPRLIGITSSIKENLGILRYWRDVWSHVVALNRLSLRSLWEDIKFAFTDQLPQVIGWFADNWENLFQDLLGGTAILFENMANNIKVIMEQVWDYITSAGTEGFQEGWKEQLNGLLDTFGATTQAFPEMVKRGLTDAEAELRKQVTEIEARIQGGMYSAMQERFKAIAPSFSAPTASPAIAASVAKSAAASALRGEEIRGFNDPRSLLGQQDIVRQQLRVQERQADIAKESKSLLERINKTLEQWPQFIPVGAEAFA